MNDYFKKLYEFNQWANTETAKMIEPFYEKNTYIAETFSHVLNAQYIWMARIKDETSPFKVRQIHSLDQLGAIIDNGTNTWLAYLKTIDDKELSRVIAYTNSFGEAFSSRIVDAVAHLVNHGSHHRGQIVRAVRLEGITPTNIDYITYCRLLDAKKIA